MSAFRVSAAGLLRFATENTLALTSRCIDAVLAGVHPGTGEYCEYLVDFLGPLSGHGHTVRGVAYLHNAVDRDITELFPWNVKSDRSVGDAPGSPFWATDPNGFGQVGCVYTAQGFEYEWSGVIIGPTWWPGTAVW
ncbi:DNA/RNA helicase domain-containing protein [Actinoplanes awajinensis]|uniref:Schlafen group 3-like DNA/RNA helicase domain-containing protein n=1 Tax=Actinoplanes awajinensis subsp. mycoplanecinus TaxID=135947 RepID=A0A124G9I0_9ACTN|nr:DNA/RNA helicase domain-containing protein [Actinoplanes awajinensis]KUL29197.1 hypothetical protein ADL15_28980 [Actinoplanes awajinensis subsp. mycoplanecinus]